MTYRVASSRQQAVRTLDSAFKSAQQQKNPLATLELQNASNDLYRLSLVERARPCHVRAVTRAIRCASSADRQSREHASVMKPVNVCSKDDTAKSENRSLRCSLMAESQVMCMFATCEKRNKLAQMPMYSCYCIRHV